MKRRAILAAGLALTAACGSTTATHTPGDAEPVTLTVFAASSLKGVFTELGNQFEAEHRGVKVTFNFAGSSDLVAQIQQGAPADVFASADEKNMKKAIPLVDGEPEVFASNTLEIAVPPANPASVDSLADLALPTVDTVVCAPEVPCGSAAAGVADAAKLTFHIVSEEQNVTDVLNKVMTGQAEAGLVYVTDVKAAGSKVKGISFPEAADVVNRYPIAALADTEHASEAASFVNLVLSPTGQKVLKDAGFGRP